MLYAVNPGDTIHYCDSDIYWVRPVPEAFTPRDRGPQALFLQDLFSAYSLRPWDFLADRSLRAVANLNSGIISAPAKLLDLEFLEWLLEKPVVQTRFAHTSCWAEQTCWALLAARSDASLLSRDVVRVVGRTTLAENLEPIAAFHVVSSCRGALPELVRRVEARPRPATTERSSAAVLVPAERLGAVAHVTSEVRFRFGL